MAQVFATPGSSPNDGIVYPDLTGRYIPVLDAPAVDGLGLTNPWGAGSMAAMTGQSVGGSVVGNEVSTPSLTAVSGSALSYNVEGLVGPQGPQGPKGDPGSITTIKQQVFVPYGDTDLDETLAQIRNTWENADTLLYAETSEIRWERPWDAMDVEAGTSSWNDADVDEDGSFMVIAGDEGLYASTNTGSSWSKETPEAEVFIQVACDASSGKAVALGNTTRSDGEIWTTNDFGANWSSVSIV